MTASASITINASKTASMHIDPKRMDEDYGKFAWVFDPEGNKVELWEPK